MGKKNYDKYVKKYAKDFKSQMLEVTVHMGSDVLVYKFLGDIHDTREKIRNGQTICKYNDAHNYTIINPKACGVIDVKLADEEEEKSKTKEFNVITLCGSTKFKEEFMKIQKELTLQGNIVISVGMFGHSGDDEAFEDSTKEMLDDMHKRKIDMAHEIFVVNKNGYVGSSTKSEIAYAKSMGKPVRFLEEPDTLTQ